jgi:hypothetical protein
MDQSLILPSEGEVSSFAFYIFNYWQASTSSPPPSPKENVQQIDSLNELPSDVVFSDVEYITEGTRDYIHTWKFSSAAGYMLSSLEQSMQGRTIRGMAVRENDVRGQQCDRGVGIGVRWCWCSTFPWCSLVLVGVGVGVGVGVDVDVSVRRCSTFVWCSVHRVFLVARVIFHK